MVTIMKEEIHPGSQHNKLQQEKVQQREDEANRLPSIETTGNKYWGEAPDISTFFGRTEELETLERWIVQNRCRLVAIVGIAGVGKTNLSVKLGRGGIGKTDL